MRVLVTGGDGFIGQYLVNNLLQRGDHVHVLDNNITSTPILIHENLTRVKGDVCDILEILPDYSPNVIVHLASVAIPKLYMEQPDLVIRPNVFGTHEVCKLAEKYSARIIFASSSEVYGSIIDDSAIGTAISESDSSISSLLSARTPYSTAKKMGEEIIRSFTQKGHSACSVRLFNVVGPNMDSAVIGYGRVIPNFVESIRELRPLTIYGNGEQKRCFLWIEDAVTALVNLIDYGGELPDAINVGHPQQISILSLANKFQEFSNADVGIIFSPKLPDEPKHRCPDISLAISMLNWRPTVDLDEIIYRVLDEG